MNEHTTADSRAAKGTMIPFAHDEIRGMFGGDVPILPLTPDTFGTFSHTRYLRDASRIIAAKWPHGDIDIHIGVLAREADTGTLGHANVGIAGWTLHGVIGINGRDCAECRTQTLIHELAHIYTDVRRMAKLPPERAAWLRYLDDPAAARHDQLWGLSFAEMYTLFEQTLLEPYIS